MSLALFDLDETLLPVDSDYLWATFMVNKGYISDPGFIQGKDSFKQDYINGKLDIFAYIRFITDYLNRLGEERNRYQEEFIEEIIKPKVTPGARELIAKHRQAGDRLMIITATTEFIVKDIVPLFEVDYLISTELETIVKDGQTFFTGKAKGVPSFREGKVTRIEDFIREHPQFGWEGSFFYSDSLNDIPLLERVDHPVAVNPDEKLKAHALNRGWEIVDIHD